MILLKTVVANNNIFSFETSMGVVVEKKLYTYQSHTTDSTSKYHVQRLKNEKQLEHTSLEEIPKSNLKWERREVI